jgi:hypothetical protein
LAGPAAESDGAEASLKKASEQEEFLDPFGSNIIN